MKDSKEDDRQLKYFTTKTSTSELACVGAVHTATADRPIPLPGSGWPAYCFLEQQPVLAASHENGTLMNVYDKVVIFQNHYFPGDTEILYVGQKRVQATLEELKQVAADAEEFVPSAAKVTVDHGSHFIGNYAHVSHYAVAGAWA